MYKGKISQWLCVICAALLVKGAISLFPLIGGLFIDTPVNIYVSNIEDASAANILNNRQINGYTLSLNSTNPDMLFADSNENKTIEGYTKYNNFAYSPMVLYVRSKVVNEPGSLFIEIEPENSNTPYKIDLLYLLENMENNKTWQDIGVDTEIANGLIQLTIPSKTSSYYKYVEELFYLTLANSTEISDSEKELLKERVETLLSKCEQVPDISQAIYNEYNNPSEKYKVFIGPEFLYPRGGDEMSRQYTKSYTTIYPSKTTTLNMDMFLKNDYPENEKNIANEFLNEITTNSAFIRFFGWRLKDTYFNMAYVSYSMPDVIPGIV